MNKRKKRVQRKTDYHILPKNVLDTTLLQGTEDPYKVLNIFQRKFLAKKNPQTREEAFQNQDKDKENSDSNQEKSIASLSSTKTPLAENNKNNQSTDTSELLLDISFGSEDLNSSFQSENVCRTAKKKSLSSKKYTQEKFSFSSSLTPNSSFSSKSGSGMIGSIWRPESKAFLMLPKNRLSASSIANK
jgi:hypothetical protein